MVEIVAKVSSRFNVVVRGRVRLLSFAQGRFRPFAKTASFLILTFQADAASLLRLVERFGIWRLWAATKLTTFAEEISRELCLRKR
jgi:hypothetical protein